MKFNNDRIEKIKQTIERVKNSGPNINQMLNDIRTFTAKIGLLYDEKYIWQKGVRQVGSVHQENN
jgi:hypothetical protein